MKNRIEIIKKGEIAYTIQGKGPVICLMATLSGSWVFHSRWLKENFTVLTYDMRGFGESISINKKFPNNDEHADDLREILASLNIKKIVLVGLSHGGAVAQHFACQYPEYLNGLVIVSSFARAHGSTYIFLKLLHGFLKRGDLKTFWEVLKAFLCSGKNLHIIEQKEDRLRKLMFDQYTCESLEHIYSTSLTHDTRDNLKKIKTPTLIIGGKEDMLFPPWISDELHHLIPNSEMQLLETAHVPPIEDPEAFKNVLCSYLNSLKLL